MTAAPPLSAFVLIVSFQSANFFSVLSPFVFYFYLLYVWWFLSSLHFLLVFGLTSWSSVVVLYIMLSLKQAFSLIILKKPSISLFN